MPQDYYTWSQYVEKVKELLPIEAQRVGVGNTATNYLTSLIRLAVIDLQRTIPGFKNNHETIYGTSDLVREGFALRGVLPPGAEFESLSVFMTEDDECKYRMHGVAFDWNKRFDLINGVVPVNDGNCRYAIDPAGHTFYVYPMPEEQCWALSLFWNGHKLDFGADDRVPFDEASILAVSYFVKDNTSVEVEDSLPNSNSFSVKYQREKSRLYLDDKKRRGE